MNNYNNMGGILSADILFKNEIALFAVHQNTACIKITEGHTWHPLHTLGVIEAPTVTPNETSGVRYINIQQTSGFSKQLSA